MGWCLIIYYLCMLSFKDFRPQQRRSVVPAHTRNNRPAQRAIWYPAALPSFCLSSCPLLPLHYRAPAPGSVYRHKSRLHVCVTACLCLCSARDLHYRLISHRAFPPTPHSNAALFYDTPLSAFAFDTTTTTTRTPPLAAGRHEPHLWSEECPGADAHAG